MDRDLGRLDINALIVHDVPSRRVNAQGPTPTCSDIESPLTQSVRNYIRDKVVSSLASNSFPVVFDPKSSSPVPKLVLGILGPQNTPLVATSKALAHHLFKCQTGSNPPGLLVVTRTTIEGIDALALMKLEREAGARVIASNHRGKSTFDVQHLRDLMLTDKTRVFKVGLFVQEGTTIESIAGVVSDNQAAQWHKTGIADFFLRRFLGCELRDEPKIITKEYLDATEDWINSAVVDPVLKSKYEIAILAEMQADTGTIDPSQFADRHLEGVHRQQYIDHLEKCQVPTSTFHKDNAKIKSRLKRISMQLESGVMIMAPHEVFEKKVRIEKGNAGQSRIRITDRVKEMKGHN